MTTAAGSLDSTFGVGSGYGTAPLGGNVQLGPYFSPTSIVSGPGGEIVEAGSVTVSSTESGQAVAVFKADGTPDTSFGTGGVKLLSLLPPSSPSTSFNYTGTVKAVVQTDGKIIVAVGSGDESNPTFYALRLDADGTVDATYGTNGVATYPSDTTTPIDNRLVQIQSAVAQTDDSVVLIGLSHDAGVVGAVRLMSTGAIDTTYGTGGTADVFVPLGAKGLDVSGAALQADGQIVIAGTALVNIVIGGIVPFPASTDAFGLRLSTSGTLDTSFGGTSANGIVDLPSVVNSSEFEGGTNDASGLAIDPTDGKIYISTLASTLPHVGDGSRLYRLDPDGTLDSSFGTSGLINPSIYGGVVVQADGKVVLAGGNFVERLNPDGTTDSTFGNSSTPGLSQVLTLVANLNASVSSPDEPLLNSLVTIRPSDGEILVAGASQINTSTGRVTAISAVALTSAASTNPPAQAPSPLPPATLDNLGATDLAVYNPSTSTFYDESVSSFFSSNRSNFADSVQLGIAGTGQTIPAVANYLGTTSDQIGVYLVASGVYAVQASSNTSYLFEQFGTPGVGQSIPVPADYYGNGRADVAVYLTATGTFAIQDPTGQTSGKFVQFGTSGVGQSIPSPADYYGTGQADIAVYLAAQGAFAIQDPTGQTAGKIIPFGMPGLGNSIPVPGDYDGSGHVELAVYVPSLGGYFYRPHSGGNDVFVPIGTANSGEVPVPGDYDASGRTEVAIYDPAKATFEFIPGLGGSPLTIPFGSPGGGSIPVAANQGALSPFESGSGQGGSARAASASFATTGSSNAVPAVSTTLTRSSAVPAGPTLVSARVALARVNQGVAVPSKPLI